MELLRRCHHRFEVVLAYITSGGFVAVVWSDVPGAVFFGLTISVYCLFDECGRFESRNGRLAQQDQSLRPDGTMRTATTIAGSWAYNLSVLDF